MAGCEDFQVAIEMRLHGALGDAGRAPLEEHLATCERCRAYEAAARGAEAIMEAQARDAVSRVDWEKVERGIRGGVASVGADARDGGRRHGLDGRDGLALHAGAPARATGSSAPCRRWA